MRAKLRTITAAPPSRRASARATAIAGSKAEHPSLAARFADDPQERFDECRLARAVAAEQAKNLTPLHAQADALQGLLPLAAQHALDIGLGQITSFNRRLIGHERIRNVISRLLCAALALG